MAETAVEHFDKLYEFDREPVTPNKFQPGRHFAGVFAGEHVAGTEFVIGALFVSWGVSTKDLLLGLLLGNFLAVLSWTLVCAPIATQTRLTLYWYLRRIAGPSVTAVYNILNAVLYCILAGAMITVSASAVRIPFGIPAQIGWYPHDIRFVLVVMAVGVVVVCLAILGFESLAKFSSIVSPWVFAMFFAGAVVMLPGLARSMPEVGAVHSVSDFFTLADKKIWVGAAAGGRSLGFWHVAAFAWICNLAMHIGLSDMALLRYARHWSYGLYSAFGMYLGHYLAWVCAGIMGAAVAHLLNQPLSKLDAGDVAYQALGVAGAIAVVLAGWTTSNPTLYRAGLALQSLTPGWPRWLVTLAAGIATTILACSPFVFQWLLQFVALYGILLMPVGAVVVAEHWLFPRLGWRRFWATRDGHAANWPALISWVTAIALSFYLYAADLVHEFFLAVPIWIFTSCLYLVLAYLFGAARRDTSSAEEEPAFYAGHSNEALFDSQNRAGKSSALVLWVSGLTALVTLIGCLVLPIRVFLKGAEGHSGLFQSFHQWLVWLSLAHLASAAVWVMRWDRRKATQ